VIFDLIGVLGDVTPFANRRTDTRASGPVVPAGEVFQVTLPEAVGGKVVIGNLAVDQQTGPGFVTAYACDSPRPLASDLNFFAGSAASNRFIGRASADGRICFVSNVATHIVFDANGILGGVTSFSNRRWDTRTNWAVPDLLPPPPFSVEIPEAAGGKTVIGNLAAVSNGRAGFVTASPCSEPRPVRADLNFFESGAVSNRFVGRADASGRICFHSSVPADLVFDASAVLDGLTPAGPRRTDTRDRPDVAPCSWLNTVSRQVDRPSVDGYWRIDVEFAVVNGPACSLDGYPTLGTIPVTHGTVFGEPAPISSIVPGETVYLILAGRADCLAARTGPRRVTSGAPLQFAGASPTANVGPIDTTCGVSVSRLGVGPPEVPRDFQPVDGDGWRFLVAGPHAEYDLPHLQFATNSTEYARLWASLELSMIRPPVNFTREVVMLIDHGVLCHGVVLRDVLVAHDLNTVTAVSHALPPNLPPDTLCPSLGSLYAVVIAIERAALPRPPFEFVWGCCVVDESGRTTVTRV
jgi:hypothetical protein